MPTNRAIASNKRLDFFIVFALSGYAGCPGEVSQWRWMNSTLPCVLYQSSHGLVGSHYVWQFNPFGGVPGNVAREKCCSELSSISAILGPSRPALESRSAQTRWHLAKATRSPTFPQHS